MAAGDETTVTVSRRRRPPTTMQRVTGLLAQNEVTSDEIDELKNLAQVLEDRADSIERIGTSMRQEAHDLRELAVRLSSKVITARRGP